MDTPIFEQVCEWMARQSAPVWPTVELDSDAPTVRDFELPPEWFVEWSDPAHEWGSGPGLFRGAVVASAGWGRAG